MRHLSFRASLLALAMTGSGGCVSLQAIEPVIEPPARFTVSTVTSIEFMSPFAVGLRCAERGAKFLGLPAINSGACADQTLITMLDPCVTVTAGSYAQSLCARLREATSKKDSPSISSASSRPTRVQIKHDAGVNTAGAGATARVTVEFVAATDIADLCDAGPSSSAGVTALSCFRGGIVYLANPCDLYAQGWYERTLCHELGHVNGWLPDHSGGSPSPQLRLASESPEALAYRQTR